MTADEYIKSVKEINPKLFEAEKIKMSPDALLRALRLAFEAGRREGKDSSFPFKTLFGL